MRESFFKSWEWFVERAHGTHTKVWLSVLSFTESSVFIIPPDPLLVAIILAGNTRWFYYGMLTTLTSLAGAAFGYILGAVFFDILGAPIVALYGWEEQLATAQELFARDAFSVMFLAAFTPIPFKVFVLAAGFLKINPFIFLLATLLGRGGRYILIAYVTHRFGQQALELIHRYSIIATVAGVVLLAILILQRFVF